jgi:hypothetical protein
LSGKSLVCKWSLRGFATSSIIGAPAIAKHLCQRNVSRASRTAPVAVGEPFRDSYASDPRNAYGRSYPDYGYWASRVEGGAISAPVGH